MNAWEFSKALSEIDDDLIAEAAQAGGARRPARHIGRALLLAAALAAATLGAALAADSDLRTAVISFFLAPSAEAVPGDALSAPAEISVLSSAEIGEHIHIDYLRLAGECEYGDGVIFSWQDGDYAAGRYGVVENGALRPLETERLEQTFSLLGYSWTVRFDAATVGGRLYLHNMPDARVGVEDGEAIFACAAPAADGDAGHAVVTLPFPHANGRSYAEYKVLLDLRTGEITDFLAGCGLDGTLGGPVHAITLSDDRSYALVEVFEGENGFGDEVLYFCDVRKRTVVPVEALAGGAAETCVLQKDGALFCLLQGGTGLLWETSGSVRTLFSGLRSYNEQDGGVLFTGGRWALDVAADGSAALLDLRAGTRTPIDGLRFTALTAAETSPDGSAICFYAYDEQSLDVTQLGLLDIAGGRLMMLPRQEPLPRRELAPGWLDSARLAVSAADDWASGVRYLYLYRFDG